MRIVTNKTATTTTLECFAGIISIMPWPANITIKASSIKRAVPNLSARYPPTMLPLMEPNLRKTPSIAPNATLAPRISVTYGI